MEQLYLVTGACGHLGNTIVKELVRQGKHVRGLILPRQSTAALEGVDVELMDGDITYLPSLNPFFTAPGKELIVIHTAGIVSIASKFQQKVYDVNFTGTKNVIAMCLKHHVKKLIYTSSVHAIAEPAPGQIISEVSQFHPEKVVGLYAQTKAAAAQLVLDSTAEGLFAIVVHPSGIIGPSDYGSGHLTQLIMDYLDGRLTACVRGGYDFVDVRDVASGIVAAVEKGRSGECYILSGTYCEISHMLQLLHEISGRQEIKTILPAWFANLTAPLAEFYYKLLKQPPLYTKYSLYTLGANGHFSNRKAREELGYTSRPLIETLTDTVTWLSNHRRIKPLPRMMH